MKFLTYVSPLCLFSYDNSVFNKATFFPVIYIYLSPYGGSFDYHYELEAYFNDI